MSNFDPNAVLRGAQLTLVGAYRSLQNPGLFTHSHYRQAGIAVAAGLVISLLVSLPVFLARLSIQLVSLFSDLERVSWDDRVLETLNFLQHQVLQVPLFLMTMTKYVSPAMDDMFMESLQWVDQTYVAKHRSEDPDKLRAMYHPNLKQWRAPEQPRDAKKILQKLLIRYGRKAAISLSILLLSCVPIVGKFVLPLASFFTFRASVGDKPALAVFASGLFVPKRYLIVFLQSYFSSRNLVRELLEPYFKRVSFSPAQKKEWFHDRAGVLFGFGLGFFLLVKIPLVGVLVYGIAEASTAYLVTKITDPPPPAASKEAVAWKASQVRWRNQKDFMDLSIHKIDAFNVVTGLQEDKSPLRTGTGAEKLAGKKFM